MRADAHCSWKGGVLMGAGERVGGRRRSYSTLMRCASMQAMIVSVAGGRKSPFA
jgi:hypothetical protein